MAFIADVTPKNINYTFTKEFVKVRVESRGTFKTTDEIKNSTTGEVLETRESWHAVGDILIFIANSKDPIMTEQFELINYDPEKPIEKQLYEHVKSMSYFANIEDI